jgi:hypothetical protein
MSVKKVISMGCAHKVHSMRSYAQECPYYVNGKEVTNGIISVRKKLPNAATK